MTPADQKKQRSVMKQRWIGVVVVLLMGGGYAAPGRSWCERAKAFVEAGTVPTTFEDVSALPQPYQKAIFNVLTVGQKRTLWTQQLRQLAATHTLTQEQTALVREALRFINRSFADAPTEDDKAFAH